MPRFRFVAADSTGQVSDGTIDAASQTDARNKLASNGLAVRSLEEVSAGDAPGPVALPRRAAPAAEAFEHVPSRRPERSSVPADAPRSSAVPLILSIIAFVLALATAGYVIYRDPPGGRLSRYDFRSPETAYRSFLRIETEGDLQAQVELKRKLIGKYSREKLNSLQIGEPAEFQGKSVLFIKYELNDLPMYEVAFMERDPDQKDFYRPCHVFEDEIRNTNPGLAERIDQWRMKSRNAFLPNGRGGAGRFVK